MKSKHTYKSITAISIVVVMIFSLVIGSLGEKAYAFPVVSRTYTIDADFDEGTLVNLNHNAPNNDQLQLDNQATPFSFIWVAVSSRGTIVKIDTNTGVILGEYRTHPTLTGFNANPSRTTVDNDGSVWVANRGGDPGSVTHVGLLENNQCEDRNGNGVIDTSTGLGDIKGWTTFVAFPRGVGDAEDECIVHHIKVNSTGTRHIAVNAANDIWVSGIGGSNFDLIKGGKYNVVNSGTIIRSEPSVGFGGYGGLIDGDGVIWSARPLLRWNTNNALTGSNGDPVVGASIGPPTVGTNWSGQTFFDSYGLCINPNNGEVWNTQLSGNQINRYQSDGTFIASYGHGFNNAQGCVVDNNGHVWVAHSLIGGNSVGHLDAAGTFLGNVTVDSGPTGVAVDSNGKIWATNYYSGTVTRIDPSLSSGIGDVDLTVTPGGSLYNYSDMTGSTLVATPNSGTWTIIYDSGITGQEWGTVSWSSLELGDSSITVTAASSIDGINFGASQSVADSVDLTVADGQHLRVSVSFTRSTITDADHDGIGDSPILYDLTIEALSTEIEVPVDIKPQSCRNPLNIKHKGVLPVAILGFEGFDVTQIDVTTVQLEGVSPLRSALEDVATPFEPFMGKEDAFDCTDEGPDGFLDLTLKFRMQDIVATLDNVSDGDVLVLKLTGSLKEEFGGTAIVGEDVIVILKKGKK